jgi:hypothetical protein
VPASRDARVIEETLTFFAETLEWLAGHHAAYARASTHDLAADEQANAVWKLGGQSIAEATALVDLLKLGYTGQTWPTTRAVHEVNRLLTAISDPQQRPLAERWLAGKKISQKAARAAEQEEAMRVAKAMREAGLDPGANHVQDLTRGLYRTMSMAAHHQRQIVDEGVDPAERTMIYGPDPRIGKRFAYVVSAAALVQEVLLLVGDALTRLWGPPFYTAHLVPMLRCYEEMLGGLIAYDAQRGTDAS